MNTKRWLAIGLSVVVFVSSIMVSVIGSQFTKEDEAISIWETAMDKTMAENVLREGLGDTRIVVVDVSGAIIQGETSYTATYDHEQTLKDLDKIKEDKTIKGMILRVDSPGGGVYESAQLQDKIKEVKENRKIPVYVVMESMAASGGYYISADAEKIYASKETITGSIGVIMSGLNLSGLMEKYGVTDMTIKSGEMKDVGSSTRPPTEKGLLILQNLVNGMYERFVDVVAQGRGIDRAKVYELADGRIYDGQQALKVGLVDAIGYYDDALLDLETAYKLEGAQVFSYTGSKFDFINQLMSGVSALMGDKNLASLEGFNISAANKKQGFMYIYGGY